MRSRELFQCGVFDPEGAFVSDLTSYSMRHTNSYGYSYGNSVDTDSNTHRLLLLCRIVLEDGYSVGWIPRGVTVSENRCGR